MHARSGKDSPALVVARILLGCLAAGAALAVAELVRAVLHVRVHPVAAVGEEVVERTPGALAELAIDLVGTWDKPLLLGGIVAVVALVGALAAVLAARSAVWPAVLVGALGVLGTLAALARPGAASADALPVVAGTLAWLLALALLLSPLHTARPSEEPGDAAAEGPGSGGSTRRTVLVRAGAVAAAGLVAAAVGRSVSRAREVVEATRRLVRLPATRGTPPPGADLLRDLREVGAQPWRTPADDFYRIDTALVVPTIDPEQWQLRIHGLVEREIVLGYDDLATMELTQAWITLCCVSNPVGGDLVGNAWWSGVRVADLLARAGVRPDADAVLQTSQDGWTCATPLTALTDDRNALVALAMNGEPLPLEHGFPARMVVPGLFGYVSATKWLVDLEVTRFAEVEAYWTERGWAEEGPVRTMSRIDVPRSGTDLPAGPITIAGVAWAQHTGIDRVEVRLDGGPWVAARLGAVPTGPGRDDTWVQWRAEVDAPAGDHLVTVRATDRSGSTQTSVRRDVVPDGATGWHEVDFSTS